MRILIIFLLSLLSVGLLAQSDSVPDKATGVVYNNGELTVTPNELEGYTVYFNTNTNTWWYWNYSTDQWINSGSGSGITAQTLADSMAVVRDSLTAIRNDIGSGGTDDQTAAEVSYTNNGQTTVAGGLDSLFSRPVGGTGITDGDKGDVTVSNSGGSWEVKESAKRARVNYKPSLGVVIGNSTVAAYNGTTAIADFLDVDNSLGDTIISIAVPGHSIDQQESAFLAHPRKSDFDYAVLQIGLNDMNPSTWDSLTIIQNYQNMVNQIKAVNPNIVIIGATMVPAYNRWVALYGAEAQDNWEDLNEAIVEGYIKGIDYTVSRHTFLLGDPSDRRALDSQYDTGDGIHENNAGRELIAQQWQRVLNEAGFLEVPSGSVPPALNDAYTVSVATPSLYSVGQAVILRDTVKLATTNTLSELPEMYILSKSGSELTLVGAGSYQVPDHGYNVSMTYYLQPDGSISTTAPSDTIVPVLYAPSDSLITFFQPRSYYDSIEEFQGQSVSASSPAFIAATGISDVNITSAIYNLEKDLRDAGVWDKLDVIYPFAGATATAHSYNLKDTSTYKITWNNTVSHTSDGISSAGNGYGDTGYNPTTLSKNTATMGVYFRSSSSGTIAGVLGATDAGYNNQFLLYRFSNNYLGNIRGGSGGPVISNSISAGSFIFARRSDNDLEGYDDGVSFETNTATPMSTLPDQNMYLLANNLDGSPTIYFNDTISFAFVGDPMSDAEILSLHNAIEAYQARMSRSSIGTADNPTTDIPAITSRGSSGTVLRYSNKATGISVTDIGDYFTGTNQETVNQEIGSKLQNISAFGHNVTTGTTDASGDIVVTHGLGATPTTVIITGGTNEDRTYQVLEASKTSTQFTVRVYNSGIPVNAGAVTFNWIAIQ